MWWSPLLGPKWVRSVLDWDDTWLELFFDMFVQLSLLGMATHHWVCSQKKYSQLKVKPNEQFFPEMLFICCSRWFQLLSLTEKPFSVTIQTKVPQQFSGSNFFSVYQTCMNWKFYTTLLQTLHKRLHNNTYMTYVITPTLLQQERP